MCKSISVLSLLCCFVTLSAQQGIIEGKVFDETRNGANHATIMVANYNDNTQSTKIITDIDGNFRTEPLQPGTYTLQVSYKGHQTITRSDIIVSSDKATFIDFELVSSTGSGNPSPPKTKRSRYKPAGQ